MKSVLLKSENLNEKAYHQLKQAIISNKLIPGTRIVESQIAEMFGISRTPAREAISMLLREGLIVNKGKRGNYVLDVSEKDINELYDIRILIEKGAIDYISKNITAISLISLEKILNKYNEQNKKSIEKFMSMDDEFHEMLVRFSENDRLIKIHKDICNQTKVFRQIQALNKERADIAVNTHFNIFIALRDREFKVASELVERHIEFGRSQALGVPSNDVI
jgi:DNA-binding GntR family transcriptional regulator